MFTKQDQRWVSHQDALPQEAGAGVTRRVLAYNSALMCVENTFEAGAVGAPHSHPHTQITYVVSGRFSFTIDGESREVGPGDTMLKTDGVVHGCTCLEAGVLLDIFDPMREDFFAAPGLSRAFPAPNRPKSGDGGETAVPVFPWMSLSRRYYRCASR